MAIRLITGVPGSGKSYYAVHHLLKTYFKFDSKIDEWIPVSDFVIFTNIDQLTLPHVDIEDACKKSGLTVEQFFTVEYQEKIKSKYPHIVYLIDEAQRFFPYRNKINKNTWFYFEYHRHLGHDIYIITQDKRLVANNITLLAETEIRAAKRTFSVFGEFRYLIKADNDIVDRFTVKPSKRVFNVYKSFDSKTSEKIINPYRKYIIFCLVSICVLFYFFKKKYVHDGRFNPVPVVNAQSIDNSNQQHNFSHSRANIIDNSNTDSYPPEKIITVNLSYIQLDKKFFVYDFVTKDLVLLSDFPYPTKIVLSQGRYRVKADIPQTLFQSLFLDSSLKIKSESSISEPSPS